jgi:type I restriction enzyme R subunit
VYEIAEMKVLQLDPINKLGTPSRIVGFFGGKDGYMSAVRELEHELYNYPAG